MPWPHQVELACMYDDIERLQPRLLQCHGFIKFSLHVSMMILSVCNQGCFNAMASSSLACM